ncbi:putative alpha-acetolactate decarboxylase [Phaeomoniella chlamydospora]|uniref:Alpha-acetolactate decarboxylase n=1 Tax=Phaeomoniella chlamydospora TaxID=158046 RepID=A0A0G2E604_PHACM|nr:putative alpha-acetolactate decarboxylase [Phaeomoniella chlamydospora]
MEDNYLYQYSLLNALMDGVSESGVTVQKFLKKGNQGLGTFVRMNGELLSLDGTVYQLMAEGKVRKANPEDQIPFGICTHFAPQATKSVSLEDKTAIDRELDEFNSHSVNLFMTYRITGRFRSIKARTVRGQEYKGQPLSELGKKQYVNTFNDIEGTIVGFRSPKSWQGFSVAGEHLHFIDDSRQVGGHVLEVSAEEVTMSMAVASNIHVELPTSEDFNAAKLVMDDEGIKGVEG